MEYTKKINKVDEFNTVDGIKIQVFDLVLPTDLKTLDEWALHFRRNYKNDELLEYLVKDSGLTSEQYLTDHVFPDDSAQGTSVKSGDFSEILVSDYLEYCLFYSVPRYRFFDKRNRNESPKGTDILAFLEGGKSSLDELLVCEVKGKNSEGFTENKLQKAIDDSNKDVIRVGYSLEVLKQRLYYSKDLETVQLVSRYQNIIDNPYQLKFSAAAVYSESAYSKEESMLSDASMHSLGLSKLLIFKSEKMLEFIKELYLRASKC